MLFKCYLKDKVFEGLGINHHTSEVPYFQVRTISSKY